jgi:hypothetical protein
VGTAISTVHVGPCPRHGTQPSQPAAWRWTRSPHLESRPHSLRMHLTLSVRQEPTLRFPKGAGILGLASEISWPSMSPGGCRAHVMGAESFKGFVSRACEPRTLRSNETFQTTIDVCIASENESRRVKRRAACRVPRGPPPTYRRGSRSPLAEDGGVCSGTAVRSLKADFRSRRRGGRAEKRPR